MKAEISYLNETRKYFIVQFYQNNDLEKEKKITFKQLFDRFQAGLNN